MNKPYTVKLMPVGRPPMIIKTATLLDALCLVGWGESRCEVYEYERRLQLAPYREVLEHIENSRGGY